MIHHRKSRSAKSQLFPSHMCIKIEYIYSLDMEMVHILIVWVDSQDLPQIANQKKKTRVTLHSITYPHNPYTSVNSELNSHGIQICIISLLWRELLGACRDVFVCSVYGSMALLGLYMARIVGISISILNSMDTKNNDGSKPGNYIMTHWPYHIPGLKTLGWLKIKRVLRRCPCHPCKNSTYYSS